MCLYKRERERESLCERERDELSHKIVGKSDVGKIEEELVRNELMGSTETGR